MPFRYDFERGQSETFFRSALVGDEYATLTTIELDAEADKRWMDWKAVIQAAADAAMPSPLDVTRNALSEAQTAIQGLQPDKSGAADPERQAVLDAAMASLNRASTAAQNVIDTEPSDTPLPGVADSAVGVTFDGLMASVMPGVEPGKVHGLKVLSGKALEGLPFSLNEDQTAYTCVCGSGWLTITGDEDAAREALQAHIAAAQE